MSWWVLVPLVWISALLWVVGWIYLVSERKPPCNALRDKDGWRGTDQ